MTTVAAFAIAGVITYLLRCSMVLFGNRLASSTVAESTISLVTPAVLSAIVASALLLEHGDGAWTANVVGHQDVYVHPHGLPRGDDIATRVAGQNLLGDGHPSHGSSCVRPSATARARYRSSSGLMDRSGGSA